VLLAAGAVVPSLLTKAVFSGPHPRGVLEVGATLAGFAGAAGVLIFTVLLLRPYALGFAVRADDTYRQLWTNDLTEQPALDLALAESFEQRRRQNVSAVRRLMRLLGLALTSLVIETAGLALAAALAS